MKKNSAAKAKMPSTTRVISMALRLLVAFLDSSDSGIRNYCTLVVLSGADSRLGEPFGFKNHSTSYAAFWL